MNWPQISLYARIPSPVEVEGGLLFHPDHWHEAQACIERVRGNGLSAQASTQPRDLGVFVEVRR